MLAQISSVEAPQQESSGAALLQAISNEPLPVGRSALFFGNLPSSTTDAELIALVGPSARVVRVDMKDGFAFVHLDISEEEARTLCGNLKSSLKEGSQLRIEVSRTSRTISNKDKLRCFNCHQEGHKARDCRAPLKRRSRSRSRTRSRSRDRSSKRSRRSASRSRSRRRDRRSPRSDRRRTRSRSRDSSVNGHSSSVLSYSTPSSSRHPLSPRRRSPSPKYSPVTLDPAVLAIAAQIRAGYFDHNLLSRHRRPESSRSRSRSRGRSSRKRDRKRSRTRSRSRSRGRR